MTEPPTPGLGVDAGGGPVIDPTNSDVSPLLTVNDHPNLVFRYAELSAQSDLRDVSRRMAAADFQNFRGRQTRLGVPLTHRRPFRMEPQAVAITLGRVRVDSRPSRLPPLLHAVPSVVDLRADEQMSGANTQAVVATVAHQQPVWDRPHRNLIGDPVGEAVLPPAHGELSVSAGHSASSPHPAGAEFWSMQGDGAVLVHLRPKPNIRAHHLFDMSQTERWVDI